MLGGEAGVRNSLCISPVSRRISCDLITPKTQGTAQGAHTYSYMNNAAMSESRRCRLLFVWHIIIMAIT